MYEIHSRSRFLDHRQDPQSLALVLGDMEMVRALGMAGIPCAVPGTAETSAVYSRFTRRSLYWDGHIWDPSDDLIDALVDFGFAQEHPPVLFYQSDAQLILIARYRERLAKVFRFVAPDPSLVEQLVDKGRFQALAEREGLPVPKAHVVDPSMDQISFDFDFPFPVIAKPLMRRISWTELVGAPKALEFESPADLREMWPQFVSAGIKLLIQESIAGPETCIESYHVYAEKGGHVVADFTGRKVRTNPSYCGHSTALRVSNAPDVADLGRDIVRSLQLEGVAKFDLKRGPDGRLNLFEINPRFSLWHHLGAAAGLNIPAMVYADLVGLPRPKAGRARPGTRWCQPLTDWKAAKEQGVSFRKRVQWLLQCEATTSNLDDPLPFLVKRLQRSAMCQRLYTQIWSRKIPITRPSHISVESTN